MSSYIPLERLTLPVLLSSWARVVDLVSRGDLPADEYAADLRIRHEIAQRVRSRPVTAETRELLAELDEWFREATEAVEQPVEGGDPRREWYFYRRLRTA